MGIDHARRIYEALIHPKSFVSLDDADHLLSRRRDSLYAADVLAAWASRYVESTTENDEPEPLPQGEVSVAERSAEKFVQDVRVGRHRLIADEPERVGGQDAGPDPYGFLLTALGACTSMTLRMYARHKKWPLEHVEVQLRHRKVHEQDCEDCESKSSRIDQIEREIRLRGPELHDTQRQRLLEIADRCPVHRTLESDIRIRTQLAGRE